MSIDSVDIIRETLRQRIESEYPSIERFAYENAINKTTLSRILSGKRDPRISTLLKIAKSLNLTLNDLYLGTNPILKKSPVPKKVKKRKITLLLAESDLSNIQDKLKSASPLTLEVRLTGRNG